MYRFRARDLASRDDGGNVEIGLRGWRRANTHALVGEAYMHGIGVGGRMDRNGGDSHLLAGAVDAQRNLAAIGDENLFKHVRSDHPPLEGGSEFAKQIPGWGARRSNSAPMKYAARPRLPPRRSPPRKILRDASNFSTLPQGEGGPGVCASGDDDQDLPELDGLGVLHADFRHHAAM